MAAIRITSRDIAGMVGHWLRCPPSGYLGSDYGSDVKSLLQSPMSAGLADDLIAKCRQDIPLLRAAPDGTVNIYSFDEGLDRKVIRFEVGGELVNVEGDQFSPEGGGTAMAMDLQPAGIEDVLQANLADDLHELEHTTMPASNYW